MENYARDPPPLEGCVLQCARCGGVVVSLQTFLSIAGTIIKKANVRTLYEQGGGGMA